MDLLLRRLPVQKAVFFVSRFLLSVVFLGSVIGKAATPQEFYSFTSSLPYLSLVSTPYFLIPILVVEAAVAILLVFNRTVYLGAILSFGLLCVFLIVLISASYNDVTTPCGCFGKIVAESSVHVSLC